MPRPTGSVSAAVSRTVSPSHVMKAMAIVVGLLADFRVEAQELEPRSYTPAPIGTTIVLASVGGSKGDILFDPSLPLDDVKADLTIVTTGLGYTFDLSGRQARVVAVLPVAWGAVSGDVHQIRSVRTSAGWSTLASSCQSGCEGRRR